MKSSRFCFLLPQVTSKTTLTVHVYPTLGELWIVFVKLISQKSFGDILKRSQNESRSKKKRRNRFLSRRIKGQRLTKESLCCYLLLSVTEDYFILFSGLIFFSFPSEHDVFYHPGRSVEVFSFWFESWTGRKIGKISIRIICRKLHKFFSLVSLKQAHNSRKKGERKKIGQEKMNLSWV